MARAEYTRTTTYTKTTTVTIGKDGKHVALTVTTIDDDGNRNRATLREDAFETILVGISEILEKNLEEGRDLDEMPWGWLVNSPNDGSIFGSMYRAMRHPQTYFK